MVQAADGMQLAWPPSPESFQAEGGVSQISAVQKWQGWEMSFDGNGDSPVDGMGNSLIVPNLVWRNSC